MRKPVAYLDLFEGENNMTKIVLLPPLKTHEDMLSIYYNYIPIG